MDRRVEIDAIVHENSIYLSFSDLSSFLACVFLRDFRLVQS